MCVPEPSASELEVAIGKLKSCKSPNVNQIPAKLIQASLNGCINMFHATAKILTS
jgi:hypothetical protein